MPTPKIDIPMDKLSEFCKRWKIVELSLFGSVLRDDFGADSDVDVLVVLEPAAAHESWRHWESMIGELREMFGGRQVDLVERRRVINPYRRYEILTTREVLYAA